jgi:sodium-dependent dicarboxylate transporter 2/3/5
MKRFLAFAAALALALIAWQLPHEAQARQGLALLVLIATLWITEALPLTFTALLVPTVGVAPGLTGTPEAFAGFAHPVIVLLLGGFALAAALSEQGIDRWIANRLLLLARGRPLPAAVSLSAAAALLSMWISNTATTAMMLPVALGLAGSTDRDYPRYRVFCCWVYPGAPTSGGSPPWWAARPMPLWRRRSTGNSTTGCA